MKKTKEAVCHKSKKDLATEFQKSLADTVVLLLQLKSKHGISQGMKGEIDEVVENLQGIIRKIPDALVSQDSFKLVFSSIVRAFNVWRNVFT